jgi:hypothetical protein
LGRRRGFRVVVEVLLYMKGTDGCEILRVGNWPMRVGQHEAKRQERVTLGIELWVRVCEGYRKGHVGIEDGRVVSGSMHAYT